MPTLRDSRLSCGRRHRQNSAEQSIRRKEKSSRPRIPFSNGPFISGSQLMNEIDVQHLKRVRKDHEMKHIALLAAAGSLAAISAPANAADMSAPTTVPALTESIAWAPAMNAVARYGDDRWDDDDWDDDDDYRDRRRYKGDRYDRYGRYYEPRRIRKGDRVWRGRDGRYYCERGNGTTGLIIGAAGGALIGRAIDTRGDRTVGTLLGGAIGALIGREIDRGELRCR